VRSFDLNAESRFAPDHHVERILMSDGAGDVSVASWEPGQIGPYHCHPEAIEAYYCLSGGGRMRTPTGSLRMTPGRLVVHPLGELHEYENGDERTTLLRVRYGSDVVGYELERRGEPGWRQPVVDAAYFRDHPPPDGATRSSMRD
jgi:mannose-6-phosphate isomerase-like protein (cupin superfamily)